MARKKPQPISDPRILRAISHPVRVRILDELGAGGPQRAADMAKLLGVPANQASFHLRQLAKYGLVVEAPEEARDGRDRVWKVVHDAGFNVDTVELAKLPGGKAAVSVFRREWTTAAHDAVERAEFAERVKDSMVMVSDSALRLTKADAKQLAEELTDLIESWRVRGRAAREGARTYQLLQILQPAREVNT
jgi:predicted ArsR family transcriptional regulator